MADKLLAEWFWTDRWMGSSAFGLPMEPRGLYREMLTQAWRRGASLPDDHAAIRRFTGCTAEEWDRCWPLVKGYWLKDGATLYNETQRLIYAETKARHEGYAAKATKAAAARWNAGQNASSNAQASPQAMPEQCPPSPDPSPDQSLDLSPEPKRTLRPADAGPDAVLAHYRSFHPRARPGAKERKLVSDRLAEGYSVADLQAAIEGNHRDPHCCGQNERRTEYHALGLIFRDSSHVQSYIDVPTNGHVPAHVARPQNVAAVQSFLERHSNDQS